MTYAEAYEKCRAIIGKGSHSWNMSVTTWNSDGPRWAVYLTECGSPSPCFTNPEEMIDTLMTRMQRLERSTSLDDIGDCKVNP